MFDGIGRVAPDCIRFDMHGNIAVKTSNGYKAYSMKSNRLINCNNFAFDIGNDFFFIVPTANVVKGDIILANGKNGKQTPKCVLAVNDGYITVINYEDSVIEQIVPERHVLMENFYFFNKIVSLINFNGENGGVNNLLKFKILSDMLGNKSKSEEMNLGNNGMGTIATMALLGGGFGGNGSNAFNGLTDMFNFNELFSFGTEPTPTTTADVITAEAKTTEA